MSYGTLERSSEERSLGLGDARTFGRTLAGSSLIVGPVLLVLAAAIAPDEGGNASERLAGIAENQGRYLASTLLYVAGPLVLIPGLLGLMRLFRGARITFGQIAVGVLLTGAMTTLVLVGVGIFEYEAAKPGLDRAQMAQVASNLEESVALPPVFARYLIGTFVGRLLLAFAVWRRRVGPRWAAVAIASSAIVGLVALQEYALFVLGFVLMLAGLGALGLRLLSMSDEEWAAA